RHPDAVGHHRRARIGRTDARPARGRPAAHRASSALVPRGAREGRSAIIAREARRRDGVAASADAVSPAEGLAHRPRCKAGRGVAGPRGWRVRPPPRAARMEAVVLSRGGIVLVLAFMAKAVSAATISVPANGDLQAAIEKAQPGDTI